MVIAMMLQHTMVFLILNHVSTYCLIPRLVVFGSCGQVTQRLRKATLIWNALMPDSVTQPQVFVVASMGLRDLRASVQPAPVETTATATEPA
mmetsp:Transcript_3269/g.7596  ORF Transcript_3269/g.7596 Transcript_3269/m.7596 type:complete len:92 (+) Transcript_3269:259-534(+)